MSGAAQQSDPNNLEDSLCQELLHTKSDCRLEVWFYSIPLYLQFEQNLLEEVEILAAVLTHGGLSQDVSIRCKHLHNVCWPSLRWRRNRSGADRSHPELSIWKKNIKTRIFV